MGTSFDKETSTKDNNNTINLEESTEKKQARKSASITIVPNTEETQEIKEELKMESNSLEDDSSILGSSTDSQEFTSSGYSEDNDSLRSGENTNYFFGRKSQSLDERDSMIRSSDGFSHIEFPTFVAEKRKSMQELESMQELQSLNLAEENNLNYTDNSPTQTKVIALGKLDILKKKFPSQQLKYNSTSSLYIQDSITAPNMAEILKCMASAILLHIQRQTSELENLVDYNSDEDFLDFERDIFQQNEIFDERDYPLTRNPDFTVSPQVPSEPQITNFLSTVFNTAHLDPEVAILALSYLERITSKSKVALLPYTWRRILLSCLVLAAKVWEDSSVWNIDFVPVFDNVDVRDLGAMERVLLPLLKFNIGVSPSMYAKYYFELRNLSELDEHLFPLKPLDKIGQERVEKLTSKYKEKKKKQKVSLAVRKTGSVDNFDKVLGRAIVD